MIETSERLASQLAFIREVDRVKGIFRQTLLMDGSRHENDAEHSWHIALMAVALQEHAAGGVDVLRVIKMLLIHDLVEIDCGDTFCYDTVGMQGKHEREAVAADRIFGILPADQGAEMKALWMEFEDRESPEARYANALDRLQPMLHNYVTQGGAWRAHGVTADRVLRRNRIIADGAPGLWRWARAMIADAVHRGFLEPGPDFNSEMSQG